MQNEVGYYWCGDETGEGEDVGDGPDVFVGASKELGGYWRWDGG